MAKRISIILHAASAFVMSASANLLSQTPELRIGIIGLDTSHAEQFTMRLNDAANPNHIPGGRVVLAYPAGSPDIEESRSRTEEYTATVRDKYGVKIVGAISELCAGVDAVMVLSLDGRPHLDQVRQVVALKKRLFLDKPVAASLKDAVEIYKLSDAAGVPLFSASSVRWYPGVIEVATTDTSKLVGAISYGPAPVLPHHPDLFFYGIHATEALFTVMGPGCVSVARAGTSAATVAMGVWESGAVGTLHAIHARKMGDKDYKVIRIGEAKITEQQSQGDYTPMLREIIKFFQTGVPPVSPAETLEIYGFMQAAEESKRKGGAPITIREVLQTAGCPEKWLRKKPAPAPGAPEPRH